MEEWAKIGLTALGACVVSWGGIALKHWFDRRTQKEEAKRNGVLLVADVEPRLASVERDLGELLARESHSAALLLRLDSDHYKALSLVRGRLERFRSTTLVTLKKTFSLGTEADHWIRNWASDASAVAHDYARGEHDSELVSKLRKVESAALYVHPRKVRIHVMAVEDDTNQVVPAIDEAIAHADALLAKLVAALRNRPSAAPSP